MARQVRPKRQKKPKTKRVLLAEAVRAAVAPVLREYGFENPPRGERDLLFARKDVWRRTRDVFQEQIHFQWDHYSRPFFVIGYRSDDPRLATLLDEGSHYDFRVSTWRLKVGPIDLDGQWFGHGSSERTIRLALRRIGEIDSFLRTGALTFHLASSYEYVALWAAHAAKRGR